MASIFEAGPVEPDFSHCLDVPNGGVLLGLPSLLSMGLLSHTNNVSTSQRLLRDRQHIFASCLYGACPAKDDRNAAVLLPWRRHVCQMVSRELFQMIPDTTKAVNPMYREADGDVRKQAPQLARKRCECNGIVLCDDIEPDKVAAYETKKDYRRGLGIHTKIVQLSQLDEQIKIVISDSQIGTKKKILLHFQRDMIRLFQITGDK